MKDNYSKLYSILTAQPARSAWARGVREYAELLLCEHADRFGRDVLPTEARMLNGARTWKEYSEGGCALIYDEDIARTLCAPWELRKTDNGRKEPNVSETWLDVQARALYQAARLVMDCVQKLQGEA